VRSITQRPACRRSANEVWLLLVLLTPTAVHVVADGHEIALRPLLAPLPPGLGECSTRQVLPCQISTSVTEPPAWSV
jgi:hypothetical protein